MPRRYIYRDYRSGRRGQFASAESWQRSHGQGKKCNIHREYISDRVISDISDLFDMEEEPDLVYQEYHATGDTGRGKRGR